uniref:Uncharacterized protein n=1 Tax=Aegilops tauschii subsp. strangulata TaxID=200361 RepID=A0A453F449_AEGTS
MQHVPGASAELYLLYLFHILLCRSANQRTTREVCIRHQNMQHFIIVIMHTFLSFCYLSVITRKSSVQALPRHKDYTPHILNHPLIVLDK